LISYRNIARCHKPKELDLKYHRRESFKTREYIPVREVFVSRGKVAVMRFKQLISVFTAAKSKLAAQKLA